ncbi:hypothetical protein EUV02_12430 [Polymorphobacter arshaanensis]|uniref:Uncharacterized protein n=1 Tax=Glacieibacterium arshaanense TaxID=2511025 RepID=A0A4Y9EK28_9SPHN|nr:hypothetical protein [Polymorphobacter arshaanensis]TFU01113.1 hypothetical protein EUV02_12430 [Polymorphobacter arshaanensis]
MSETGKPETRKEKFNHEMTALFWAFLYLFILFGMLRLYGNVLLAKNGDVEIRYGLAALNALIFAKVILIGNWMHIGQKSDDRPLLVSVLAKSVAFSGFFIAFHFFEEAVVGLFHHKSLSEIITLDSTQLQAAMVASVIFGVAMIPYFAIREVTRAIGWERLKVLLLEPEGLSKVFGTKQG